MTDISAGIEIPVPEPELTPGDMLARATGLREFIGAGVYRTLQQEGMG